MSLPKSQEFDDEQKSTIEDWLRFQRYASFVQTIIIKISTHEWTGFSCLNPSVITRAMLLTEALRCSVLQTRNMVLEPRCTASVNQTIFLIHDKVESLKLNVAGCSQNSLNLVLNRVIHCQDLRRIVLSYYSDGVNPLTLAPTFCSVLKALPRLTDVYIPSHLALNPEVWDALQCLPSLCDIHWSASDADSDASFFAPCSDSTVFTEGFERLSKLTVFAPFGHSVQLFKSACPSALLDIHIRIFNIPDDPSLHRHFCGMGKASNRLNSLHISLLGKKFVLSWTSLSALTTLPYLRVLSIRTEFIPQIDDDDIYSLSRAMPHLEELSISPDPTSELSAAPKLTLHALSNIASHCRSLKHVGLYVNVSPECLPSRTTPLNAFSRALKTVNFGLSPAERPEKIALRLIRIFQRHLPLVLNATPTNIWVGIMPAEVKERFIKVQEQWSSVHSCMEDLRPFIAAIEQSVRNSG